MGTLLSLVALPSDRSAWLRSGRRVLAVAAVLGVGTAIAGQRGYRLGPHTVVRCRQGHLFTTAWIPGASLTALRLGWWRFQRCPMGRHWTLVHPVREADLTAEERRLVAARR